MPLLWIEPVSKDIGYMNSVLLAQALLTRQLLFTCFVSPVISGQLRSWVNRLISFVLNLDTVGIYAIPQKVWDLLVSSRELFTVCPFCKKPFVLKGSRLRVWRSQKMKKPSMTGPYCSYKCSTLQNLSRLNALRKLKRKNSKTVT